MSANLSECVINNFIKIKNNVGCCKWEIAMWNESNSLNEHNAWKIVKPEKLKSKWVHTLKETGLNKAKFKTRLVPVKLSFLLKFSKY